MNQLWTVNGQPAESEYANLESIQLICWNTDAVQAAQQLEQ